MVKNRKVMSIFLTSMIIASLYYGNSPTSAIISSQNTQSNSMKTDTFSIIDENGNFHIIPFDEVDVSKNNIGISGIEYIQEEYDTQMPILASLFSLEPPSTSSEIPQNIEDNPTQEEKNMEIEYGVVYLNSKSYNNKNYLTYKNISNPGNTGYVTGAYAKDAAFIGIFEGKIRAKMAGVVMDFYPDDVSIVNYTEANISHYFIKEGYLYHKFFYGSGESSNQYRVGYALPYMKEGVSYYSYDGHYFYTEFTKMIDDYKNNTYMNAINKNLPYYNYYQFLSHRSQTSLVSMQLDDITYNRVGDSSSKLKGMGEAFINIQNTYGANALLMYGVAANESGYGTSAIAMYKNNLFGHNAVDSNPYYGANGYESPEYGIQYHAETFISSRYLNFEDWRYNGPHLGDKASGMNVRYASDPYWGEKAASVYYYNDSGLNDFNKYKIAIIEGVVENLDLYTSPSTSSQIIQTIGKKKSPKVYNLPIVILETVKDENGNEWYKIQNDTVLSEDKMSTHYNGQYSFSRDYLYIRKTQNMRIAWEGNGVHYQYKKGDVNNNNKIDAADYLIIMDTILGKYKMNEIQGYAGDVNGNGKIDAADYLMIMDNILGKIQF